VVDIILRKSGIIDFFEIITPRQKTHLPKPNPSPYFTTMRQLALKTSEVLIFEDSPTGLQSARATNANVIKVDSFEKKSRDKNLPYHVIDNFSWLISILS